MLLNASNQLFFISCAADRKLPYSMKEVPIMAKTEIDVNQLPAGLTKKDSIACSIERRNNRSRYYRHDSRSLRSSQD